MTYEFDDMTMSDMLRDPLIRQMMRADGMALSEFAVLLEDAARQRHARGRNDLVGKASAAALVSRSHPTGIEAC